MMRLHLFRTCLLTICLAAASAAPARLEPGARQDGAGPRLPAGLEPLVRGYPAATEDALRALKKGIDAFSRGSYAQARLLLPGAAAAAATAVADYALLYRARTEMLLDRNQDALEAYRSLESRFPGSPLLEDGVLGQCQALLKLGKPADLLNLLRSSNIPRGPEALYYEGRAQEELGKREEAADAYFRVFAGSVGAPVANQAEQRLNLLVPGFAARSRYYALLLERSENLLLAGRSREARALLLRMVKTRAPDAAASGRRRLLAARADYGAGRVSPALAELQNMPVSDPVLGPRVLSLKASCYRRLERREDLAAVVEEARRRYPHSPETAQALQTAASYYDLIGQTEKARETYLQLVSLFPSSEYAERASWRAAFFAYLLGRYGDAARELALVLERHPDHRTTPLALYWLGRTFAKAGRPGRAVYLMRRCLELAGPGYYGLLSEAALSTLAAEPAGAEPGFQDLRRIAEAIRLPDHSIPPPSPLAAATAERVRQLASAGLLELASSELRRILRLHPGERPLRYVLARVHDLMGDPSNAIMILRRLLPAHDLLPPDALPAEVWNLLYPIFHQSVVEEYSARNGIEPALVLGLIRQESGFAVQARSPANAMGLMQILPSTGRQLARRAGVARFSTARLHQAEPNLAIGTLHLGGLLRRFEGDVELPLAAYNAGESRVRRWRTDFGDLDAAEFVDRIPLSETRDYVKNVIGNRARYRSLLGRGERGRVFAPGGNPVQPLSRLTMDGTLAAEPTSP